MNGPRTTPVLVNRREHEADVLLREVGAENGDRLLAKVRLADVVDPGDWMGSRRDLGTYALQSHLDFVMVDDETSVPRFAVEIDGAQHSRDPRQRQRDLKKDELCRAAGLPLLRVNSEFGRREGRHILLKYICDAFYKSVVFEAAQESGAIPRDEPYWHASFIERDEDTGAIYFGSIDAKARAELLDLWEGGSLPTFYPEAWIGEADEWGDIRAEVYLPVGNRMTLVGSSRVRQFGFFGIAASELAEELAILDLRRQVDAWLTGEAVALSELTFRARFRAFVSNNKPMNHTSSSGGDPDDRIPYPPFEIKYGPEYAVTFAD